MYEVAKAVRSNTQRCEIAPDVMKVASQKKFRRLSLVVISWTFKHAEKRGLTKQDKLHTYTRTQTKKDFVFVFCCLPNCFVVFCCVVHILSTE